MKAPDNSDNLTVAKFKMHNELDMAASERAKKAVYREIEVCEIAFAANKQTTAVFPAHEVFGWEDIEGEYGSLRTPITYAMKYSTQYLQFKNGGAQIANGTPIDALTSIPERRRLELKALKVHTVEALAAIDGSTMKMLGQGGRDMKNAAVEFLANSGQTETAALKAELAEMKEQLEEVKSDAPKRGRPPKAKVESTFETFDDADILNWLRDADPKSEANENTPRAELIAAADAILAKEAKAKAA